MFRSASTTALAALFTTVALTGCPGDDGGDPDFDAPTPDAQVPDARLIDAPPIDAPEIDGPDVVDCEVELPCPAPTAGHTTICGRLQDTELAQPIAPDAIGARCETPTADGPCSLRVLYFDALEFSQDPGGTAPLVPQDDYLDGCGRYRATNLPNTAFGFTGVAVDDATGTTDRHALTTIVIADATAHPAAGLAAYATRRTTDATWTSAASLASSFATRGVLLSVFRYHGAPVAGVRIHRNGAEVPADETFGFSDTTAARSTLAPAQELTGANGSVLTINAASVTNHVGAGGEPAGCGWPTALATTIPGVVFVQISDAQTAAGAPCP